jgi:glycosyltransferase involved in cell wall biosynthesis
MPAKRTTDEFRARWEIKMSVSVLIPAHNEQKWLNRTIDNIFNTATGEIEVIVVLNGYDQEVDSRAKVVRYPDPMGERAAMNVAARIAKNTHLIKVDGHCDFAPNGWDVMMEEATSDRSITVAALAAVDKNWNRVPHHWYGFCKLLPNMEAKWATKKDYKTIEPNMAFTGCGFMLTREFYWSFGGADESLPGMGATGEEFSCRGWLEGDGVYTRTDVTIGHIFNTGGYPTADVLEGRRGVREAFGDRYDEIAARFPHLFEERKEPVKADEQRTVTVQHTKEHVTKDAAGKPIMKRVEHFKYVWIDDGSGLTEEQVAERFASKAQKVGESLYLPNQNGELVKVGKAQVA